MSSRLSVPHRVVNLSEVDGRVVAKHATKHVVAESTVKIKINGEDFVSLLCLPVNPAELALGFLFNEGRIEKKEDLYDVEVMDEASGHLVLVRCAEGGICTGSGVRKVTTTSAKGITLRESAISSSILQKSKPIPVSHIWRLMKEFSRRSSLHEEVGGVHSALFHHPTGEVFREDIGRHNCLDRIAGNLLADGRLDQCPEGLLLSSGRISTEMLSKALRMKIPVYVSRTTPTAAVVELAVKHKLAVLGYVRNATGVVYTGMDRILFE